MPYYVFAVKPFAQLECLADFEAFKEASLHAKAMRAAQAAGEPVRVRIMFAADARAAEDLLLQVRDAGPAGDD
jgi:hypothetical protein